MKSVAGAQDLDQAQSTLQETLASPRPGQIISLIGPPAAGRRTLLRNLRQAMDSQQRLVLSLELPIKDLDSGSQALASLAASFPDAFDSSPQAQTNEQVLARVTASLRRHASASAGVALVYVPWFRPSAEDRPTETRMARGIESVLQALASHCAIVIAAGRVWPLSERSIRLSKYAGTTDWIDSEFPDRAHSLGELFQQASHCSRLELRLAYGLLVAGKSQEEVKLTLVSSLPLENLAASLWEALDLAGDETSLRVWRFLAAARGPVPLTWLDDSFGEGTSGLPILRHALTYQEGQSVILHERLRAPALKSLLHESQGLDTWKSLHELHADCWQRRRSDAVSRQDSAGMIQADLHFVYHSIESGRNFSCVQDRVWFQEQLCLVGRALSKRHRRYDDAQRCFLKAREIDAADAYAWHYWSYNLAKTDDFSSQDVEEGFAQAVALEPWQLWYQQRWVRWLLARGRRLDAQKAWLSALQQTTDDSELDEPSLNFYRNLHWLVAERALSTGALEFADLVLKRIPAKIFELDDNIKATRVKFEVLRLAESDHLVRPMSLALARGTIDLFLRPELLPQRTADGEVLTGWYAARIESIVDEQLHLLLGMPSTGQVPHVDYLRTTMSRQVYDSVTQDEKFCELVPGRYLEIGEYGPAKKGHIRVFTMDP